MDQPTDREMEQLYDGVRQATDMAARALGRQDTHEAVCAERYKALEGSLDRVIVIAKWGFAALAGILAGQPALPWILKILEIHP